MKPMRRLFASVVIALASIVAPGASAIADDEAPPGRNVALVAAFADTGTAVSASVVSVVSVSGDPIGFAVAVEDGSVLLTSATVADAAKGGVATVQGAGGFEASASVRGKSEGYGIALLEIRGGKKLTPIAYGASAKLEVGQFILSAGGEPGRPIIAVGIVSAVNRRVEARPEAPALDIFGLFDESEGPKRSFIKVLQHDSPISIDQHGSPVVDADGKLVGTNIASVYRGTTFAAPIDEVRPLIATLRGGKDGPGIPKPGYLGVAVKPLTPEKRTALGIGEEAPGVEVAEAVKGLPAEQAGLKAGDVIVSVAGRPVASADALGEIVRGHMPGDAIEIVVRRGEEDVKLKATLAERP
jgi:S1-C subfamily serine protease